MNRDLLLGHNRSKWPTFLVDPSSPSCHEKRRWQPTSWVHIPNRASFSASWSWVSLICWWVPVSMVHRTLMSKHGAIQERSWTSNIPLARTSSHRGRRCGKRFIVCSPRMLFIGIRDWSYTHTYIHVLCTHVFVGLTPGTPGTENTHVYIYK